MFYKAEHDLYKLKLTVTQRIKDEMQNKNQYQQLFLTCQNIIFLKRK